MASTIDLTNITHYFQFYSSMFVCSFGLITNLMNIHVCLRPEIQKTNMGFYNIFLSISNIFTLTFIGFISFLPRSLEFDLFLTSNLACKMLPYFSRVFAQLNSWLSVLISFDRVILMSYENRTAYNNRSIHLKDKKSLMKLILGISLLTCLINIPGLFFYLDKHVSKIDPVTNQTITISQCMSYPLVEVIRDAINLISKNVAPLVLQLAITIILVYKLYNLKINVTTLSLKKEYVFTLTIVVLNINFILTDLFNLIATIVMSVYGYNQTYISTTSNQSAFASFVFLVSVIFGLFMLCDLLFFINLATHLKFRKEAKAIYIDRFRR